MFRAPDVELSITPPSLMELSMALHSLGPAERGPGQPAMKDALARALEASRDPLGVIEVEPWQFYLLSPESVSTVAWLYARLLEREVGVEGARAAYEQWQAIPGWIVVTCAKLEDASLRERAREDSLTAVQRYSLSLWSDNIPTNWVTDVITEAKEIYDLVGIDPQREGVLGILWYGHAERGA